MRRYGPDAIDRLREALPDDRGGGLEAPRPAAVLVPLFVSAGEVHILLTKRSASLTRHRGEISFPGGAWDPTDPTLERTALREAHEEVGLRPDDVDVLGILPDVPTASSDWLVRPFVGEIPHPYEFVPDAREVERVLTAPLASLAEPGRRREEVWERDGYRFPVYFFDVDGEVVWGLTGRLLVVLLHRIEGRDPPPSVIGHPPQLA